MSSLIEHNYYQPEFELKNDLVEPVGRKARSVLFEIVNSHPNIKLVRYFHYDMRVDSDGELLTIDLNNLPRNQVNRKNLQRISDDFQKRAPYYGMGISSQVVLDDDSIAHIPMIDFMSRYCNPSLSIENIQTALKPYSGYIIETGQSMHYWGKHLLTPNEWEFFMKYAYTTLEGRGADVCTGFYDYSLRRGFSGLRIYAYPPIKRVAPYVVAKV